jgi:hypothetical protein
MIYVFQKILNYRACEIAQLYLINRVPSEREPSYPPNSFSYVEKLKGGVFAHVINPSMVRAVGQTCLRPAHSFPKRNLAHT